MDNATKELIIKALLFTPTIDGGWGLPMTFWGEPGTGKSAIVVQVSTKFGLFPIVLAPNSRSPMDILGLPTVDEEKYGMPVTSYASPDWAMECLKRERCLLFIDERNTADPALQAPMLRILRDKVVGELQLPGGVRMMSACNPVDQAANGWEEAPALANRSGHMDWDSPSVGDWAAFMSKSMTAVPGSKNADKSAGVDLDPSIAEAIEAEVCAQWADVSGKWLAIVESYLKTRPEMAHKMPDTSDPQASRQWPSFRTWDYATRALAGGEIHGLTRGQQITLVASFVGEDVAFDFAHWLQNQDLPNPVDLLDGKVEFEIDKNRQDRTYATLNACATACQTAPDAVKAARVKAMWALLAKVCDANVGDMTVHVVSKLTKLAESKDIPKLNRDKNYIAVHKYFAEELASR